jgi:hypothetical protein
VTVDDLPSCSFALAAQPEVLPLPAHHENRHVSRLRKAHTRTRPQPKTPQAHRIRSLQRKAVTPVVFPLSNPTGLETKRHHSTDISESSRSRRVDQHIDHHRNRISYRKKKVQIKYIASSQMTFERSTNHHVILDGKE